MMNNIMLDLETMGTDPTSAIIAIGAVRFDPNGGVGDTFYRVVSLESSVAAGMVINPSTVMWWMKQSEEARSQFNGPSVHIYSALTAFADWIGDNPVVWGNGAAFDNVILSNAYKMCGMDAPWKFWNDRCYRTVSAMHPETRREQLGTYHNALDDARSQALHLIEIGINE